MLAAPALRANPDVAAAPNSPARRHAGRPRGHRPGAAAAPRRGRSAACGRPRGRRSPCACNDSPTPSAPGPPAASRPSRAARSLPHAPSLGQVSALVTRRRPRARGSRAGRALVTAPIDKAGCARRGLRLPRPHRVPGRSRRRRRLRHADGRPAPARRPGDDPPPAARGPAAPRRPRIVRAGRLLALALRNAFRRSRPVIGVLGLNPHAGERGLLGDEETTIVAPAIEAS
jgi:hypothetical protein